MMPFLTTVHLANDPTLSLQKNGQRYHAVNEFWPQLEKLDVHQQNANGELFDKAAGELGYSEKLTTDRDCLLTLLCALDTYGENFACDGGDSRRRIADLINAFQAASACRRATTGTTLSIKVLFTLGATAEEE